MRRLQTGGDIPVDVTHIIMVLVFTQVGQIDTGAPQQRAIVPLQQSIQTSNNGPLQAAQDMFNPLFLDFYFCRLQHWRSRVTCCIGF